MKETVVVTGLGAVTPLGLNVPSLWESLLAGRSGIDHIQQFDVDDLPVRIGGEVNDFDPLQVLDRKEARRMDRFTQMALVAAAEAMADAGLKAEDVDGERMGVYLGVGMGGIQTLVQQLHTLDERGPNRVSPFFIPMMIANMAAGEVAIRYGAKGANCTVVTACASSGNAIGEALRLIRAGELDVMIVGGAEAPFTRIAMAGFCSMRALSTRNEEPQRASRPFDLDRDGFVMSEGAGILILESLRHAQARGAQIYGVLAGYGATADAHHITQPAVGGEGGARAMRLALADAGLEPTDIDYINAHGTSTPTGDPSEISAIKSVFGEHASKLMVSSTKSMTGHLLGAAGAVELIASLLTIKHGMVPPTINYETPDPECDLDVVPNHARQQKIKAALSNSFGFGGHNACLIVRALTEES